MIACYTFALVCTWVLFGLVLGCLVVVCSLLLVVAVCWLFIAF